MAKRTQEEEENYFLDLNKRLTQEKILIRKHILANVSSELKNSLLDNQWFMTDDSFFGCGVYSDAVNDDGLLIDGICYEELEKYFKNKGMKPKDIANEFTCKYLRQYFMEQFIDDNKFEYNVKMDNIK